MKGQEIHSIFLTLSKIKKKTCLIIIAYKRGKLFLAMNPSQKIADCWKHISQKIGRFALVAKKYCMYLILNEENTM